MTCPSEYPCHRPEKVAGKCCKVCPGTKRCWGQWGTSRRECGDSLPRAQPLGIISDRDGEWTHSHRVQGF